MPTAPKLVAAFLIAALGYFAARAMVPYFPNEEPAGLFKEVSAALGLIVGWRVLGRRAGQGMTNALGFGLTAAGALVLTGMVVFAGYEMLVRSLRKSYAGPVEALEDMFAIAAGDAALLGHIEVFGLLVVGGLLAGAITEISARILVLTRVSALFLYGTLRHPPLLARILGRDDAALRPARLAAHAVRWADGESFPLLLAEPGATAEGSLLDGLTDADLERLDFYEAGFGYRLVAVTAETAGGPVEARVYLPDAGLWTPGAAWSLADWVRDWGAISLRAAQEVMGYFGAETPEEVARRFPLIRLRAASWVRAQSRATPMEIRAGLTDADVESDDLRRPYSNFFMLEEQDVRFRHFDGTTSARVERAAFVSGDAVTVLPYDPVRDRVLVVEQFRFAPLVRGDRHPWTLEPIAGRIDPGETPEDAAVREAREESGLVFDRLEPVARYYTSAGAVTEYIFSYVAIADLPDGTDWLGGEAAEAEDIRSVVLDFDTLMAALDSGEAETAPLILSALWLQRHRDRLRAAS